MFSIGDAMNTDTIPAKQQTGYSGYWPDHPEGLEFDADIYKAEVRKAAQVFGFVPDEDDLEEFAQREAALW